MKQVYATECTEYEAGWGQRPDGITISEDLEKLNEHIKKGSTGSPEYFWRYSNPIILFVEDKQWETMIAGSNTGLVHVDKLPDGFFQKAGGIEWRRT